MYGSDYLFPVLLARKSGGGGGQPTFNYGASLSMTIDSSTFVVTAQLLDQNGNALGQAQTIDLPLESVVVGGSYDDTTKKVILTLQNGNTVEFSVADLVSGLQTELSASNKLDPSFINYDNTHAAVTEAEKTSYAGKQNAITARNGLTFGTGADADKLGHSNSVTAQSTQAIRKTAFDAQGHVTGSTDLTTAEADAIASGITSADVTKIGNHESAIVGQQNATTAATPGNGYAIINGIRLYASSTAPTGDIPDGSIGIGW
jgi:hypothetical protein